MILNLPTASDMRLNFLTENDYIFSILCYIANKLPHITKELEFQIILEEYDPLLFHDKQYYHTILGVLVKYLRDDLKYCTKMENNTLRINWKYAPK